MLQLHLPSRLTLASLARVSDAWPADGDVEISFGRQAWVLPSGMVGLSCLVESALQRGQRVFFSTTGCDNASYWRRMGFFALFGDASAIHGNLPQRRFSEIRRVSAIEDVDRVTEEIIDVVAMTDDARRIYSHVVSEALNNVCQHSNASGFCASQFYPSEKVVRFCISDHGIGLRAALERLNPADDGAAIALALEVGVSGRSRIAQLAEPGAMRNRGVGLTAIDRLVRENGGEVQIWSGATMYQGASGTTLRPATIPWQGTLVAAKLPRNHFSRSFGDIMRELTAELRSVEVNQGNRPWRRFP